MFDQQWIKDWGPKAPVTGLKAAASTDSAIVTDTILRVMKEGGNAVDAAIAGCLVQAAVEPFMTNHTGTVTFLYYEAKTGRRYQLDSVGTFPDGLAPFKPIPPQPHGYAMMPPSACIPGFMPGLKAIFERFGTKPWARLCEDAIRWADEGHPVSSFELAVNIFSQDFVTFLLGGAGILSAEWLPGAGRPAISVGGDGHHAPASGQGRPRLDDHRWLGRCLRGQGQ